MYRYIGRAIFTNKTNHYGLKWRQDHVRQFAGGGILVIRNPYTAIISFWNYEKTRTHSVFAEKNSFCSVQFREFAFKSISRCRLEGDALLWKASSVCKPCHTSLTCLFVSRWHELAQDWLAWAPRLQVVLYEDLVLDPVRETQNMLTFLGSAANRLIGEVVQSRRRPLLGPSPG